VGDRAESVLHDIGARSLFELADGVDRVMVDDGGVVPLRIGQAGRDDILLDRVDPVRVRVTGAGRPDGGKTVVGAPADEDRVAPLQQLGLDLDRCR
jgi:hypothetical protein